MSNPGKTLVLFDFDGTLTRGDSLRPFLLFSLGPLRLAAIMAKIALPYIGLALRGKWNNGRAKEILFSACFRGYTRAQLEKLGRQFAAEKLPAMLRTDMMAKLQAYEQQADICLVSASADTWLAPFCEALGISLICTVLQYEQDRFTGHFSTPNCQGEEKKRRILAHYDLNKFDHIVAFGNSGGDEAMFELAQEVHWC